MSPAGATLPALLAHRAAATPRAIAYRVDDARGGWQSTGWAEFADQVQVLAGRLQDAGLRHGDRLAIICPVSLQWELIHHAALALGAVVVGLDTHDLPARVAAMAAKAEVSAFAISDGRSLSALGPADWQRTRFVLALDEALQLPAPVRRLDWHDVTAPAPSRAVMPAVHPGDLATIIFTSGTTGEPKGIAYRHEQVCLAIDAIRDAFPFAGPGTRLLCWLPLSNLFQRIVNLAAVATGTTTYLWADPRRVMEALPRVEPDVFIGVPRFFEKLHEGITARIAGQGRTARALVGWAWQTGREFSTRQRSGRPSGVGLKLRHALADRLVLRRIRSVMGQRLRCMVTGSAPASKHLLEEFHALGWLVLEAYGMSENVVPIAMNRIDRFRFGTVGQPVSGNDIRVREDGAVLVRGSGVFEGYLNEGAKAAAARDADGFYATGDLGAFDTDGFLTLTGRDGDLIKTSTGRRIAPAAVEAALRSVPGIDQAVLMGNGRKLPIALCALTTPTTDHDMLASLAERLTAALAPINERDRPAGLAFLQRPLSLETGELTPNLKLRRAAIEKLHEELLGRLDTRLARRDAVAPAGLPFVW